jgi:multidrug efflux pump subunit AcrB
MKYINSEVISSDDPQALSKLNQKALKLEQVQNYMKAVNAYYRKHGTCVGYPGMEDNTANILNKKVEQGYSWEKQPFPGYKLTNNNAEIKRIKNRIAKIEGNIKFGFRGWEFQGGHAEANVDINRLQLYFNEKPTENQRSQLKANGFKWAPTQGAWQRQLNDNAIYAANRIDFIKPLDGRTVREHQPKTPSREMGGR